MGWIQEGTKNATGGGGDTSRYYDWADLFSGRAKRRTKQEASETAREQYSRAGDISDNMQDADEVYNKGYGANAAEYKNKRDPLISSYLLENQNLKNESNKQSSDAKETYTNTIQPRLKSSMEDAGREAQGAMTLQQAGDPNNSIHTAVRGMYDQQADNTRRQGMQDYGVLAGLGAQAAGSAMGAPMTQGAQANIYAANQSQAGEAVARAGQRVNDLKQQGIDRGFDESSRQYDRGQGAKDRYRQSLGDITSAESDYHDRQRGRRDERGGLAGDRFGVRLGQANENMGFDNQYQQNMRDARYRQGERMLGAQGQKYGYQQGQYSNDQAAQAARDKSLYDTAGSLGTAAVAASDENLKDNIEPIKDADVDEFLDAVKPKAYDYKEPTAFGQQEGRRLGFMLQDVQGTKLGKAMTRPGNDGRLYFDRDNFNGILLAALKRQRKAG